MGRAKEPVAGPRAVSRCPRRVAVSSSRRRRIDDRGVTFRVKDDRVTGPGRHTTMTLPTDEFVRRPLSHALSKGQHRMRHDGVFGNGNRTANIRSLPGARSQVR